MLYIIYIISILLYSTISYAQAPSTLQQGTPIEESDCMVQPPNSPKWYPCNSQEAQDANCLHLLEKAMKAADPYLLPSATAKLSDNIADQKLWARVKALCWEEYKQDLSKRLH